MNRPGHVVLGGTIAGGGYLYLCKHFEWQPTLTGFAVSTLGGIVLGTLADMLDPAFHPNHRQFFHSATLALAIGVSLKKVWDNPGVNPEGKILVTVLGLAYISHPVADSFTPKGIPLI